MYRKVKPRKVERNCTEENRELLACLYEGESIKQETVGNEERKAESKTEKKSKGTRKKQKRETHTHIQEKKKRREKAKKKEKRKERR